MKIWVYCVCFNERDMAPFFMRHYNQFADRITFYDDHSTDGTREFLGKFPNVVIRDCPWIGIEEDACLKLSTSAYKEARGEADWIMWVDMDEFVYDLNVPSILERCLEYDVVNSFGFNMAHEGMPEDDGISQIWEIEKRGVLAPCYGKPVVFKPGVDIGWIRGKHKLENVQGLKSTPTPMLKILHYRYMGYNYTKNRNARNYDRCVFKGVAWSCLPTFTGDHSPEYARKILEVAKEVI